MVLKSTREVPVQREKHETFTLTWVTSEELISNWESFNQNKDHDHWIYFMKKAVARAKELGYDVTSRC